MSVIYLHVGDYKTGTSSIQHLFAKNFSTLREKGLNYSRLGRGNIAPHLNLVYQMNGDPRLDPDIGLWSDLRSEHTNLPGNINTLVSSEALQNFLLKKPEFVRELIEDGIEVKIVYYVRPHGSAFMSRYAQRAKRGKPVGSMHDFFELSVKQRLFFYKERYVGWCGLVGPDNVIFRPFQKEKLHNQDVVDDILDIVMDSPIGRNALHTMSDINITPSVEVIGLMQEAAAITSDVVKTSESLSMVNQLRREKELFIPLLECLNSMFSHSRNKLSLPFSLRDKVIAEYYEDALFLDEEVFNESLFVPALESLQAAERNGVILLEDYIDQSELNIHRGYIEHVVNSWARLRGRDCENS